MRKWQASLLVSSEEWQSLLVEGNEYSYAGYNLREEISKPPTHTNYTGLRGIKTASGFNNLYILICFFTQQKTAKGNEPPDGWRLR